MWTSASLKAWALVSPFYLQDHVGTYMNLRIYTSPSLANGDTAAKSKVFQ